MRPVESSAAVRRDLRPIKAITICSCKHRDLMIAIGYLGWSDQIHALVPSFGKRGNLMSEGPPARFSSDFCNPEVLERQRTLNFKLILISEGCRICKPQLPQLFLLVYVALLLRLHSQVASTVRGHFLIKQVSTPRRFLIPCRLLRRPQRS